jgi:SPP1 family predicted phage head-tail adaptor
MTGYSPLGAMRHRLRLDRPVETPDLAGGVLRSFVPVATLWGAIEPLSRRAGLLGDAPASLASHRVTLRWRADVAAGHRLTFGARRFEIRTVTDPDERRLRLHLEVEEIDA